MIDFLYTKTPLFFLTQSFWRDEAFSYFMAKKNVFDILSLNTKDFSPPLYSILLKYWISVFGSTEVAIRFMSFISYLLLFYFFYLFLIKILKIKSLWIYFYLILFLINPMLHYYAFEARSYAIFSLFSFMSFYFFLKKDWNKYLLSTVAGLYIHYFMMFVLITQSFYIFITIRDKKIIKKLLFEIVKPFILFLPWLIVTILNINFLKEPFWIEKITKNVVSSFPVVLYTGYEQTFWALKASALKLNSFFIILFAYGFMFFNKQKQKNKNTFYLILLWTFLPAIITLLLSMIKPVFFPRYLILSTSAIILLIIMLLENFGLKTKILISIILCIFTLNYSLLQIKHRHKDPFNKIVGQIKSEAKTHDQLFVESELNYHVAQYYFYNDRVFIYGKDYKEIPNFTGKVLIPKESIAITLPKYPRKAFILHNNLTYDIQSLF